MGTQTSGRQVASSEQRARHYRQGCRAVVWGARDDAGVDQRRVVANKRRREEETRERQVGIKTVRDLVARVGSVREKPQSNLSRSSALANTH